MTKKEANPDEEWSEWGHVRQICRDCDGVGEGVYGAFMLRGIQSCKKCGGRGWTYEPKLFTLADFGMRETVTVCASALRICGVGDGSTGTQCKACPDR